jgi:hypothetical protein
VTAQPHAVDENQLERCMNSAPAAPGTAYRLLATHRSAQYEMRAPLPPPRGSGRLRRSGADAASDDEQERRPRLLSLGRWLGLGGDVRPLRLVLGLAAG